MWRKSFLTVLSIWFSLLLCELYLFDVNKLSTDRQNKRFIAPVLDTLNEISDFSQSKHPGDISLIDLGNNLL